MMNGIGGDLFAIVYDAKANKLYGFECERMGAKRIDIEYLRKQGVRSMPQPGSECNHRAGRCGWMAETR